MDFIALLLIAVGLAMDAFTVSICKGLAMKHPTLKSIVIIALWFGGFQALMPIIGYLLGSAFITSIKDFDHWIAFGLLAAIGIHMMIGAFREEEKVDDSIGFVTMLFLAIATSIDALAVGISLAMDSADIYLSAAVIGTVTSVMCVIGVKIGSIVGDRYNKKAEFAGGLILVLIGFKILLEHLGYL